MKTIKLFAFALLFVAFKSKGQSNSTITVPCGFDLSTFSPSPGGSSMKAIGGVNYVNTALSAFNPTAIITCGKFKVYYEDMQQNLAGGFNDPSRGAIRRNTFCAVLNYIQSVLAIGNATTTIDLYVDLSYCPANPAPPGTGWAGIATPVFPTGVYGAVPGFYGGNLFDHITTGVDPAVNDFDAKVSINFDLQTPPFGMPVFLWDDYTSTSPSCGLDMFQVILHELTHAMGWFSAIGDDGTVNHYLVNKTNTSGIGFFSKLDEFFLYKGDPRTGTFNKLVTNSNPPVIPGMFVFVPNVLINVTNTTVTNSIWMTNNGAPNNSKVYDGYWPNTVPGFGVPPSIPPIGSWLSHLDMGEMASYRGGQHSPGYQPKYLMGHQMQFNQKIREWSLQELRALLTMGYSLNTTFASSSSLSNGAVPNSNLTFSNSAPIRSNYNTTSLVKFPLTSWQDLNTGIMDEENSTADFTIVNSNAPYTVPSVLLTINLQTTPGLNISDPNGDPIGIYPNSLYGIRGVTTGGNNHNSIVQTNSFTIQYSPPPGFYGRAAFAFNLWDGKEKGGLKIITIEVLPGTWPTLAAGTELLLNGSFEDATEVKTSSNSNAATSTRIDGNLTLLKYTLHQSGGHPYQGITSFPTIGSDGLGIIRKDADKSCWGVVNGFTSNIGSSIPYEGFGSLGNSCQSNPLYYSFGNPLPSNLVAGNNECYGYIEGGWGPANSYGTPLISLLYQPLQTCGYYRLEFDAVSHDWNAANYGQAVGFKNRINLFAVNNLSNNSTALTYTNLFNAPIDFTVSSLGPSQTNTTQPNWQRIALDFVYCGAPTSTIMLAAPLQTNTANYSNGTLIDNISIKEQTVAPPPLIVTATNSNTLFCPGGTFTLTGNAVNSSCSTNFTWQPMNFVSPTVMVTPPTPTVTYTLFANDGCRTGSAVVTPAPLPVGTFTAGPVCIGHTSNFDLQSITPASITLPAGYTGPALNWSVSSTTGGISTYIDLTAPNNTFAPGVYNYTLTQYLPAGCFQTYTFDVTFLGTPTVVASPSCILPGQSSTISATPSTWSYTWMPTSITGSSFVVTPTSSVTYDLRYDNGVCSAIIPKNAIVTMLTPVTFTNLPTTWCTNQTVFHLNGFLAAGVPTTGQWFSAGPSTINSFINGLGYNFVISPTVAAGVYTINYIYSSTSNTNCNTFSSFTVNIIPNFTLSVSGPSLYCSNLALGAVLSASATSTNVVSYGWMPGSLTGNSPTVFPTSATVYTVDAFDGTCSRSATLAVNVQTNCCSGNLNVVTATVSSGNIGANGLSTSINQNVTITGSVNMVGEIRIASGVSITVANGATLTIFDKAGAHLYGCGDMWHGIIVNNTAQLNAVAGNVLIEDAVEAVSIANSNNITTNPANYNLRLNNVVFNRNLRGIVIRNSINNSPFDIRGCVFTCRNYTYNVTNWVNSFSLLSPVTPTNVMGSPYDMLGAPPIGLKPPHNFLPNTTGILVENSGIAGGINTPFPNFLHVIVGDQLGGGTLNLFDRLIVGINSVNSSVASYNNVFQNSNAYPGAPGAGISSVNSYTNQNNYTTSLDLVSPVSPSVYVNHFYDCVYGIFATNLYHFNMQYSEFQSTQASSIAITPTNAGYCGIYVTTNSYNDHNVSYNKFMNVYTGVYYGFIPAPLYVVIPPSYGMFWGNVKINNNLFCPDLSPVIFTQSTLYLHNAVILDNPMNSSAVTSGLLSRSIEVNNNQMHRVNNGISATGFWKGTTIVKANNNYISLSPTFNSIRQFAIKKNYNVASSANTNTIISLTAPSYTNMTGIYGNYNINLSAQCNSVSTMNNSFDFEGWNQATKWRNNVMADSYNGLKLSINGEINTQGSNTNPSDNYWQNSTWWSMPNNCTFNDNSQVLNSKLYLRNNNPTGGYFPTYNTSVPVGTTYTDVPGSAIISSSPGPLLGCIPPFTGARMDSSDYGHLDTIAQNLAAYMVYQNETEEINRELLFENLVLDTALRNGTPVLNNFYSTNYGQELGALGKIEDNFSNGNFAFANSLLAGFTPTSNIQANYKAYYQLYHSYCIQGYLTSKDSTILDNLARKCPYIDGLSVYKARALNNIIYKRMELYEDVFCLPYNELGASMGEARKMRTNTGNLEGEKLIRQLNMRYQIFPNPAADELFITGNTQSENLHIVITDVNSKVLVDQRIELEGYVKRFKPDLLNGIYFISLENEKGERLIKKLVISK